MCCFSQSVKAVADTRIFARPGQGGRQFLVYEMRVDAPSNLAMVLPLPVPPKSMEGDVRFISLKDYEAFFADLTDMFPKTRSAAPDSDSPDAKLKLLEKIDVGDFVASYVPTIADFQRLDPQFRMPPDAWNSIPQYKDYGFAVFQLKPGVTKVHPMAFDFPRRNVNEIFFPTVHIHDGKVHETAHFDHMLFLQVAMGTTGPMKGWGESEQPAKFHLQADKTQGIVDLEAHVFRRRIYGDLPNRDTIIA